MNAARVLFGTLVIAMLVPIASGGVPGVPIAAGPGGWVTGYATGASAVPVGGELTFFNGDLMRHNVVAFQHYGADDRAWCESYPVGKCPLFWSALVGTGAATPVLGLDALTATRTYTFYCTIHPSMKGTLVALPEAGAT